MADHESAHAHPLTPPDRADRTIDIKLSGLPGTARLHAADVYCPAVRRSGFDNKFTVNHLDVVSCWKGLALDQATEIATWERLLGEALEAQMLYSLCEPGVALPDTHNSEKITYFVDIDLSKLVHDMMALHFERNPSWQRKRTWFKSSYDLPTMVFNLVRTHDCFIEASPRPCVQVDLVYTPSVIVGEIIWQPPYVDFADLPSTLPSGASYSIRPEYHSPDLGNALGPRFLEFPDDFEFRVGSDSLPLQWQPDARVFRTILPDWKQSAPTLLNHHVTETIFTVNNTLWFPGGVRYERISRYSIKLIITHLIAQPGWTCLLSQDPIIQLKEAHATTARKRKAEKQVPISSIYDATAPAKASQLAPDQLDDNHRLELTVKRQRYQEDDAVGTWTDKHLDNLGHLSTSCIGEAQTSGSAKKSPVPKGPRVKSRAYTSSKVSRVMPALRKKGSVKRMLFTRPRARRAESPAQTVIRENYEEFKKASGVKKMDLEAEEEARVFESIFLEGSASEGAID